MKLRWDVGVDRHSMPIVSKIKTSTDEAQNTIHIQHTRHFLTFTLCSSTLLMCYHSWNETPLAGGLWTIIMMPGPWEVRRPRRRVSTARRPRSGRPAAPQPGSLFADSPMGDWAGGGHYWDGEMDDRGRGCFFGKKVGGEQVGTSPPQKFSQAAFKQNPREEIFFAARSVAKQIGIKIQRDNFPTIFCLTSRRDDGLIMN